MRLLRETAVVLLAAAAITGPAHAQDPVPPPETLEGAFPAQRHFSPYAGRNFPTQVFWGDTHLHTALSMDAGAFGNRLGLDEAYRFARGEEVTSATGQLVRLSRPLDFLVVADHSDNMGFFPDLFAGAPQILADPTGKRWYEMIQAGGEQAVGAALEIIDMASRGTVPEALIYAPGSAAYRSAWEATIEAAERHNEPGRFCTAWSSTGTVATRRSRPSRSRCCRRRAACTLRICGRFCRPTRTGPEAGCWPSHTTAT
jgi:hypothetical protein